MNSIDILIRSLFDPKGSVDAKKAFDELGKSIEQGIGIAIGQKLTNAVQALPQMFVQAAKAGVDFNATLEQNQIAFETLLGSASAAKDRVQELFTFAAVTPFEFGEVVRADKILQSLTGGALAGEKGLRLVGDAASAAGVNFEEAAMWIGRLYGGLQYGTPVGEATLRLTYMGLISGQTATELQKLAESGDGMGKAMEILDRTFSKTAGSMEKQSKTLNGQMSTLRDNFKQLSSENTKEWFEAMKAAVGGLNDVMSSPATRNYLESLRGVLDMASGAQIARLLGGGADQARDGNPFGVGYSAPNNEALIAQSEELETAIRRTIKARRDAGEMDFDEAARLAKHVSLIKEQTDAVERLRQARALAANLGRGRQLNAGSGPEALPQMLPDQALTDAQKKINDETNKAYVESLKSRMEEKTRLAFEQMEAENEIEEKFANNKEKREEELFKIREIYAVKLGELENEAEQKAYEQFLDDEEKKRQAHAETVRKDLTAQEDALRLQREGFALERAKLDANFAQPDYQKRAARLTLLKQEIAAVDALIKKLIEERELESDPATKQLLQQRIQGLQSEKTGLDVQRIGIENSANPFSFAEQFQKKWTEMMTQIGTTAQMAANAFEGAMNGAISSVSGGITDLIMGTKTWGESLRSIYQGVMQSIIQEIVNMGVKWFVTHVFMQGIATGFHALMRLLNWETAAENTAAQAAQTPLLATNAALSSVASWGGALIAVAALAALVAGFAGGFKEGGFTGEGNPNAPAGLVHRGEFVFTAPQTAALGRNNLAAMASGNFGGIAAAVAQQTGGGGAGPVVHNDNRTTILPVDDGSRVEAFLRSTPGRKLIIDLVNGSALELGQNT